MKIFKILNSYKSMKHPLLVAANNFLTDYEKLYTQFWTADFGDDMALSGAVKEARYIGNRYLGIEQQAFDLIEYKVEHTHSKCFKSIR